jgi:hypothetical protein
MTSAACGGRTLFGVELPYNVADLFLSKPEEFFSCRHIPAGLRERIPRAPYGPDRMAQRVRQMGADFAAYDLRPHDLDAAVTAARWARRHELGLALNNPVCQINGSPTPGLRTWAYPPDLLRRVQAEADLVGVIYDELIHHQVHPGLKGSSDPRKKAGGDEVVPPVEEWHTNLWHALADVADLACVEEAYDAVEAGLQQLFAYTAGTGVPAFTEQVVPALYHAVARAGGNPGCKVLKEQLTPVTLTHCMGAAAQYRRPWYACVDLWEGDSGPWYHTMGRHSGHSPVEYLHALKLMALLNPSLVLTESADVLWVIDAADAALTEFGEAHRMFTRELLPAIAPAFDAASWQPTVAFVRCEDGCYTTRDDACRGIPGPQSPDGCLLGAPHLPITDAATRWLRAWYHLSWGRCTGTTLHNYFSPIEGEIAAANEVSGSEHNFWDCPPLAARRGSGRVETHMHSLFTPLNNVAVFDGAVTPERLEGVSLVVLCGSYCRPDTQHAVQEAVRRGARCLCQAECAPEALAGASGVRLGAGYWWTVADFDEPAALEQFLLFRGYHNQWVLRSKLGLLRIYSTDPWGNQIAWELEDQPVAGRASVRSDAP